MIFVYFSNWNLHHPRLNIHTWSHLFGKLRWHIGEFRWAMPGGSYLGHTQDTHDRTIRSWYASEVYQKEKITVADLGEGPPYFGKKRRNRRRQKAGRASKAPLPLIKEIRSLLCPNLAKWSWHPSHIRSETVDTSSVCLFQMFLR